MNIYSKLKSKISVFDWQLLFKFLFFGVFCIALIYFLVILIEEKNYYTSLTHATAISIGGVDYFSISSIRSAIGSGVISSSEDLAKAYNQLSSWTDYPHNFPIIGFSLMWFIPDSNKISSSTAPLDGWNSRWNNITLAYSYFFITLLIAIVAIFLLFISIVQEMITKHTHKKYNITPYPVKNYSYDSFTLKNVTNFAINLSFVFAFCNFLSTIIVLAYWTLLYLSNLIVKLCTRNKIKLDTKDIQASSSDMYYLICIMIFLNAYTILKSYFINQFGVNLDLIMSIILPIGTMTVIVGLFVKNMISSKLNGVKNKINNIYSETSKIKLLVKLNDIDMLNDYDFVSLIPTPITNRFLAGEITKKEIFRELGYYNATIKNIEKNIKTKNEKNKKYFLYVVLNKCNNKKDLDMFYENLVKLNRK